MKGKLNQLFPQFVFEITKETSPFSKNDFLFPLKTCIILGCVFGINWAMTLRCSIVIFHLHTIIKD